MINLKVLILTSEEILASKRGIVDVASSRTFFDSELDNYIKLLVSSNIPFDVKSHQEIELDNIIVERTIQYSTIILTVSENQLSDHLITILTDVSFQHGVCIIASFNQVGSKLKKIFGIDRIIGRRLSLRCIVAIQSDNFHDSKVENRVKLGNGIKIGWQRFGLRRHPIRYLKIHIRKFLRQVYFYFKVSIVSEVKIFAFINNTTNPAITMYPFGKASNYYISLQSNAFLSNLTSLHKVVKDIILKNSGWGMVNINLENTMVLRMDDPGTCERIYLKGYDSRLMTKNEWKKIKKILAKHNAKLSVMYIPKWIDDANSANGALYINGKKIEKRQPGTIYNSRDVTFIRNISGNTQLKYDYSSEYQALCDAFDSGLIEIESHGLTHVDPHIDDWFSANDRYSNLAWYHEFRHVYENCDVKDSKIIYILNESYKNIEECFGVLPTTITPSGHEQSRNADILAFEEGYKLFSSGYNATKKSGLIIRNDKIESIFFEITKPSISHLESGYPVVGVFHDYDMSTRGKDWIDETIRQWLELGFNKIITLKELAGYLCASINGKISDKTMYIDVDVSRTGDVSNKIESRYFFQKSMEIEVTIPKKSKIKAIELEGKRYEGFTKSSSSNKIKLSVPPFFYKDKQVIKIRFELL